MLFFRSGNPKVWLFIRVHHLREALCLLKEIWYTLFFDLQMFLKPGSAGFHPYF